MPLHGAGLPRQHGAAEPSAHDGALGRAGAHLPGAGRRRAQQRDQEPDGGRGPRRAADGRRAEHAGGARAVPALRRGAAGHRRCGAAAPRSEPVVEEGLDEAELPH